ncbi:MAG TPA: T9SS type A sorting domain-containing protein, partial [Candidatus Kapabacteria bacterium]|nr:T9SS type A sorting domain-containing protein [Candidatus Kapabacteria bacterium]
ASYLHYVDQAIPPAKFIVVGTNMAGSQMYLARVDITPDAPAVDEETFVYYHNNTPLFGFRPSNGWQGDGAGKIKLVAALDTVRINDMTRLAATHFRIDTTRASATGRMNFQANGSLLATGARPAGMEVLASGAITGYIDDKGIHLSDPLRSGDWKGLFGSTMTITLIEPETFPKSTSMKLSGTLRIKGMRRCGVVNGDLTFTGLKIMPTTAQISYLDAIQPEPGVCYMNLIATYHPQADSLALYGNFQSKMYFKEGMIAGGYVKNGELGQLKLATTLDQAPLGPDGLGNISNFTGTYNTLYANWMGSRWPVFNFASVSGRLYDGSSVIAIDLKDAVMTAPGVLDNDDVTYNMYSTADGWHVQGKSDVHVEWSPGIMRFSPLEEGELGAMARWNGGFYFNGTGAGSAYKQLGKKTTSSGVGKGIVEIPGVPREPYFQVMQKLISELVFSQLILNLVGGNPNAGSKHASTIRMINGKAYVTTDSKGYYTGPMEFDMALRSIDPGFFSPVSYENFSKAMTSRSFTNTQSIRPKGGATQAASNEFDVPENARGFYVRIAGIDGPATTSLTTPSGETITAPRADSSVYITKYDDLRYWWVVDKPASGKWTVNTLTGKDTVQVFVFEEIQPLAVTAENQNGLVNVSWQNASDDSVMIFVDDNNSGFDGLHVTTVDQNATNVQFALPSELTACSYNVYVVRRYAGELQMAYGESSIDNSNGKLAAPAGFVASYNTNDKSATLSWSASQQLAVAGYVLRLVGNGIDSIVSTVFADVNTITFPVADPNGLSVAIMSYDTNGTRGCWSALVPLSTSDVKESYVVRSTLDAVVLPNPARSRASLYLRMDEGSDVRIEIYDATGRTVNKLSGYYPMGEHDINLQTEQLPSGSYVAVITAGSRTQTRNFVITR